ncbi:MAG: Rieske 2Fe-2S domain-containing protein [Acidobacteriota bacterium]
MSVAYQAVQWNRQKKRYDQALALGCLVYLGLFLGVGFATHPEATPETLLIRGLGTLALLLLHIVLIIGPLARLDRRFAPLLYNRRHLGVTMFLIALAHGIFSTIQFHVLGSLNPLVNLLIGNDRYGSLSQFPFQPLGAAALAIFFLMAATSHDFWLANLTAPTWKALHMLVYVAYGLVIAHVALGVLQVEDHPVLVGAIAVGMVTVLGLHLVAGFRERDGDRPLDATPEADGFVEIGAVDDIDENRACTVFLEGERVAVFRYEGKISAISSVCKHQNGPLGEGKIVDGCVVCPWHGYQYLPESGASPPPFTETLPTFDVRVHDRKIFVHPTPLPPGTPVEPARFEPMGGHDG